MFYWQKAKNKIKDDIDSYYKDMDNIDPNSLKPAIEFSANDIILLRDRLEIRYPTLLEASRSILGTGSSETILSKILSLYLNKESELIGPSYCLDISVFLYYAQDIKYEDLPLYLPTCDDIFLKKIFKWRMEIRK